VRLRMTNRRLTVTSLIVAAFVFLTLVILSPLALHAWANSFGLNWSSLSNIGQTYGAVSALITALALGGVVISLWYQAREVSATRAHAVRTFHFDLLRMELEDEGHMWASGAPWGAALPADYQHLRRHIFVHMWLSFWQSQFLLNEMSARSVRGAARELFFGKAAREYWEAVGQRRLEFNKGRDLEFLRIIDEQYREAIRTGPPVIPQSSGAQRHSQPEPKRDRWRPVVSCVVAAAAGLIAGQAINNRR
jgi:Family of unknown function (DUF6082)